MGHFNRVGRKYRSIVLLGVLCVACPADDTATGSGSDSMLTAATGGGNEGGSVAGSGTGVGATTSTGPGADETAGDGAIFDLLSSFDARPPVVDECKVADDMNGVGECDDRAPADSFALDIQWVFGERLSSLVTPLVGNFTDDDGNGEIDLCDIPDVILVATDVANYRRSCNVFVLDGATGVPHFAIPTTENVSCAATPAFGDIDDDGLPELVALYNDEGVFRIKAFEHDGTLKWANTTDGSGVFERESGSVALYDLDADGDVEILFNHEAYDHEGNLLWTHPSPMPAEVEATTAADLDGDGQLEVLTGHAAYRADGSVYFDNYPTVPSTSIPQVGNLDDDAQPEILVTSGDGLWLLDHTGAIQWGPVTPTGVPTVWGYLTWMRPATIHDFDGDGRSEWASSSRYAYAVYEGPDASDLLWEGAVEDNTGAAGGTAFDFLGDGVAEAMYADESTFRIYDGGTGAELLSTPRGSITFAEYPVVADIDNDGSAEVLVVSHSGQPALQAIRDAEDRWIQARRIWNQHAYHVTNVREDSTIPQVMANSWENLNTFRTNAQIQGGNVCDPRPRG